MDYGEVLRQRRLVKDLDTSVTTSPQLGTARSRKRRRVASARRPWSRLLLPPVGVNDFSRTVVAT
ncbi:hypothetical protein T03_5012 [Trichinella britovi]|uniref:Uncharacterized protein n=1 Tax=Trichinella britovi TaxID=45882 RepID=A0A0V1C4U6_TRIBR|nr:hypothetical protein T03_5012 [Trichinella britovi]KRZ91515.1 hypothetical protein T08_11987 [Trichinella sp. T8]